MPTGSGKTLISELIMINTLMGLQQSSLAIFMAPSRALVHEKFDELSRSLAALNLKVCQITGEVAMESEAQITDYDVAVVTPEKFDMLMRKRFYGARTGLLVVDEFHNIRLGFRGIRIQFGLLRFIEQHPLARIVLMSAVIPNASQVGEWIDAKASVISHWQPTYARVGILKPEETLGRIEFSDGAIRRVPFTRKFKGPRQRAAYVAIHFTSEGPCMLFSSNQDGIFSYSKYLVDLLQSSETSLVSAETSKNGKSLSERLRRLIGDKEDIYRLFERGIGVHWGDLPHEIRRIVEAGLRENVIKLVVATTTLAEGVNLPLKTVVIPTAAVAGLPMDMSVFFNLMGRAGRPNREVEGQLVLMNPARKDQPRVERYFEATHASLDPIQTAILRIVEAENSIRKPESESLSIPERKRIERLKGDLQLYWAVLQSVLVAALEEKLIAKIADPILAEKVVIGSRNLVPQETYTNVLAVLQKADSSMKELRIVDEQGLTRYGRDVVYPSGFSPETCRLLESRLKEGLARFSRINRFDTNKELIATLLQLMNVPIEARMFFPKNLPPSFEWMVLDWMDGWQLTSLANKYFEGRISETMTQIQGKLSAFAAWFLYAIFLNAKYLDPKSSLTKTIEDFPKYSWFGTRDPIALRILSKDLSRELLRDDVLRVVEKLGHSVADGLVKNPIKIESSDVRSQILGAVRQSDGEEFVGSLQKILARK